MSKTGQADLPPSQSNLGRLPLVDMAWILSTDFFLKHSFPKSHYTGSTTPRFSKVARVWKMSFHDFKVKEWEGFNRQVSKVMTGRNTKRVPDFALQLLQGYRLSMTGNLVELPHDESSLHSQFKNLVLLLTNNVSEPGMVWCTPHSPRLSFEATSRKPDFSLELTETGQATPIVLGETKLPFLELGSGLTADRLTARIQHKDFLDDYSLTPFFQALSYAIYSKKGVGILTNYDQTRFFRVNLRSKEISMSPVVLIDQRLDERNRIPHAMQTLLLMKELADPDEREFSVELMKQLYARTERKLDILDEQRRREEQRRKEEKARKRGKEGKKAKKEPRADSSSKGGGNGKHKKTHANDIFPSVSRVFRKCKKIGVLGEGVTGEVIECDYDGLKVAVKVGSQYSPGVRDRDCEMHVREETDSYEVLKELQGTVIPRVVEAGLDTVYTTGMMLITEKVGMEVEEEESETKIYVGGKELDRENLLLMKEKGLEGLRKINAHRLIHQDSVLRNSRVEMKDGKVDRVWWVDLGDMSKIKVEREIDDDVELVSVWDKRSYVAAIDKYLEHAKP